MDVTLRCHRGEIRETSGGSVVVSITQGVAIVGVGGGVGRLDYGVGEVPCVWQGQWWWWGGQGLLSRSGGDHHHDIGMDSTDDCPCTTSQRRGYLCGRCQIDGEDRVGRSSQERGILGDIAGGGKYRRGDDVGPDDGRSEEVSVGVWDRGGGSGGHFDGGIIGGWEEVEETSSGGEKRE